jgi:hypothetical protein
MPNKATEVPLEDILEWFHHNYGDAVHSVFYDGREGGYQYAPDAGPCDPLDELREEFPCVNPGLLQKAADILGSSGGAWVRRGRY